MSIIQPSNIADLFKPQQDKTKDAGNKPGDLNLANLAQQAKNLSAQAMAKPNKIDQATVSSASVARYQQSYQYSGTMTMNITTKEGDEVKVDFRQLYAQYQEYSQRMEREDGPSGVRYFETKELLEMTAFEERFAFSVEGDLNEEELAAIFDIFEQVDKLTDNFFNGDIEKAFQQAIDLQIDYGQISKFSLDLEQSYAQVQRYQEVQAQQANENAEKPGLDLNDLPPYLQQMQAVVDKLDEYFEQAQEMFDQMMAGSLAQRFGDQDSEDGWLARVKELHANLLDWANKPTTDEAVEADEVATKEVEAAKISD